MIAELVSIYGLLALSHLFIQINLSHYHYLKSRTEKFNPYFHPSVSIVIPTYNEDYESLNDCVKSCLNQHYSGKMEVVVVNDGSPKREGFEKVRAKYNNHPLAIFVDSKKNKGKRHAQKIVFDEHVKKSKILVTIDSDTILRRDTVKHLVQKFQDPTIGAVTGDVRVIKTKKLLSLLIDGRYWTAFNQERAAQSLFGTVLCCSGPLAAYRSDIIEKVKEKYVSQQFLGEFCTYGDDRHLTNLILNEGYKVNYYPQAKAFTHVPQTIKGYLKQQTRWNKSFYRELLWTIKMIIQDPKKLHGYIIYDLAVQFLLPILLIVSLIFTIYKSIYISPIYFLGYITVLIGIGLIRGLYGFYRTRDPILLIFPLYAFVHIFLLIPTRIYSIMTMKTTHWGTR